MSAEAPAEDCDRGFHFPFAKHFTPLHFCYQMSQEEDPPPES